MENGKVSAKVRKVRTQPLIPAYVEQIAAEYIKKPENRDHYRGGGFSLLVTEALKEKLGIE